MAKTWQEVRKNIKSVSDSEKAEIKRQADERARKTAAGKSKSGRDT